MFSWEEKNGKLVIWGTCFCNCFHDVETSKQNSLKQKFRCGASKYFRNTKSCCYERRKMQSRINEGTCWQVNLSWSPQLFVDQNMVSQWRGCFCSQKHSYFLEEEFLWSKTSLLLRKRSFCPQKHLNTSSEGAPPGVLNFSLRRRWFHTPLCNTKTFGCFCCQFWQSSTYSIKARGPIC